jgi:hypothetical protein
VVEESELELEPEPELELELSAAATAITMPNITTTPIVVAVTTRPEDPASGRAGKALAPAALPAARRRCLGPWSGLETGALASGPGRCQGISAG